MLDYRGIVTMAASAVIAEQVADQLAAAGADGFVADLRGAVFALDARAWHDVPARMLRYARMPGAMLLTCGSGCHTAAIVHAAAFRRMGYPRRTFTERRDAFAWVTDETGLRREQARWRLSQSPP